ncbi:MAG: Threonine synthase, partial [Synergistales bacterium 58_81]
MAKPLGFKCVLCGREFDPRSMVYTCPDCGPDGTLDVLYDHREARKRINRTTLASDNRPNLWRYEEILPVERSSSAPDLSVGWTPLYRATSLSGKYGVGELFVKDDGRNPTGSL